MRYPTPLFPIIVAKLLGGSGGGSVTPASIVSATGQMTSQQAADTLDNIGGEPKKLVVNVSYSGNAWSADKTLAELNAARTAGKTIEFYDGDNIYPVVSSQNGTYIATKVFLSDDGHPTKVMSILYNLFGVYVVGDGPFAEAPISITCTMTSQTGGTWSGATFAELQAACAAGRVLNANVVGVANVTAFMQDASDGTAILTSPFILPSSQYGVVILRENGTFVIEWFVTPDPHQHHDLSSTSITLAATDNTEYYYGELTALTISSIPASGWFSIVFNSGATPTVLTVPNTMIMPDGITVEANTRYEINVKDGYALVAGWAVGV